MPRRSQQVRALIKPDGNPFEEADLSPIVEGDFGDKADRINCRNFNADTIAQDDAIRMLIAAGPGTGKSHLFLTRIRAWSNRFPDHSIFVSSFVRKLVQDLDGDVQKSGLRDGGSRTIEVATLHRIARSVVERNQGTSRMPMEKHIEMIGPEWKTVVWEDVVHATHTDAPIVSWSEFEGQYYNLEFPDQGSYPALKVNYEKLSRFYNAIGFADSIVYATEALEENETLRESALWIFDEFQDFNTAEERLVAVCTGSAESILLAGDDDQAIYQQMKGSHPEIIRSYYRDNSVVNAMLPFCGRSSYHICMAAAAFLDSHAPDGRIEKVYLPLDEPDDAQRIQVVAATTPSTAVSYVREFVESHRDEIAARRDQVLASEADEPFLLILTYGRDVNAFLGDDAEELAKIVDEWTLEDLGPGDDYFRVKTYFRHKVSPSKNFPLRKVLHYEGVAPAEVSPLLQQAIETDVSLSEVSDPLIDHAADISLQVARVIESDENTADDKAAYLSALIYVEDVDRLASDLASYPLVSQDTDDGGLLEESSRSSPVELMTMAGAKGLSADHVIILGADPINMQNASIEVFYVALTRARESLHAVVALGARGANDTHPYLLSLPEEHCEYRKYRAAGLESFERQDEFTNYFRVRNRAIRRARKSSG